MKQTIYSLLQVQLFNGRKSGLLTDRKKHKAKIRERPSQSFQFGSIQICRTTFCFLHNICRNTLTRIAKSLDDDGFKPRVHGNKGNPNKHSMSMTDTERIKQFIVQYAQRNALPLPGRVSSYRENVTLLLPSDTTQADVHSKYEELAKQLGYRSVSLRTFQRTWNEQCPYVLPMRPATDLCGKCQDFTRNISNSGILSEDDKICKLLEYEDHLAQAKSERDYYRSQTESAKNVFAELDDHQKEKGKFMYV